MKCKKGFKQKNGKCVKNSSKKSSKKNYNPFKMWGSYVGGVIYLIPLILLFTCTGGWGCLGYAIPYIPLIFILNFFGDTFSNPIILSIIIFITGFLVGWGVHSLIRRFK